MFWRPLGRGEWKLWEAEKMVRRRKWSPGFEIWACQSSISDPCSLSSSALLKLLFAGPGRLAETSSPDFASRWDAIQLKLGIALPTCFLFLSIWAWQPQKERGDELIRKKGKLSWVFRVHLCLLNPWMCNAKSLQSCPTPCDPPNCSLQALLSMVFSKQEYWSELPCPPLGDLPYPGIELLSITSPALAGEFFTTSTTW